MFFPFIFWYRLLRILGAKPEDEIVLKFWMTGLNKQYRSHLLTCSSTGSSSWRRERHSFRRFSATFHLGFCLELSRKFRVFELAAQSWNELFYYSTLITASKMGHDCDDCCRGLSKQQVQRSTSAPLVSLLYLMLCKINGSVLIQEHPGSEFPQKLWWQRFLES